MKFLDKTTLAACLGLCLIHSSWALPKPQGVADRPEDAGLPTTPKVVDAQLVKIFKYWSEWTAATYCVPQLGKPGSRVFCETYGTCNTIKESKTEVVHTWKESVPHNLYPKSQSIS
jgi:hypothetical protein